jgi:transposase
MSRATAYRLQRRVQVEGETALDDKRHGHVYKLQESMCRWLVTYCQQAPHTPSHLLQRFLQEQFNVDLSIGYLHQMRAKLGVRYVRPRQGKKPLQPMLAVSPSGRRGQVACRCLQLPTAQG